MALMWGINQGNSLIYDDNNEFALSTSDIAYYYLHWYQSDPFDMGNNTQNALNIISNKQIPALCKEEVRNVNQASISNGSVMRCTPLAVWASSIQDPAKFREAIAAEV